MVRLKNLLKKGAALLFAAALSTTAIAASTSRHVTLLQSYEQLRSYVGQDGIFFVANAASSTADGAHGDPTVKSGWAMYIYQGSQATAGSGVSTGGWRKIAEGESLDSSVNELLLRNYVAYYVRTNDLEMIRRTYETKEAHNAELAVVRNDIANHETRITTNTGNLSALTERVRTVEIKADKSMDDIVVINQKLDDMQLDEVRRNLIDATNRVTIAEKNIADTIEIVTNAVEAVKMMEADVATNKVRISELDYGHNVNSQRIDAIESFVGGDALAKQAALDEAISNLTAAIERAIADAKAHSDSNDTTTVTYAYNYANSVGSNAVVQAEAIADTKKSEAIQTSKDYTDAAVAAATDRAYVDAQDTAVSNNVVAISQQYTEDTASNCVEVVKAYADEKEVRLQQADLAVSNAVLSAAQIMATQEAANALTSANLYTDTEIGKLNSDLAYIDVGRVDSTPFVYDGTLWNYYAWQTVIGAGAKNPAIERRYLYEGTTQSVEMAASAINISCSTNFPSYTYGDFNINLGIDNLVGYDSGTSTNADGTLYNARYSVAIGTSVRAKRMHSYGFGSQINALGNDTTVIGYGASATSNWSTVIGHGRRPLGGGTTPDKNFTNETDMVTWLQTKNNGCYVGYHFKFGSDVHTITGGLDTPDANGYYYTFETSDADDPDYMAGGYDWRYGKSHGPGTFNIVAWHSGYTMSPGLKGVWINDDCLYDLVMDASGGNVNKKLTLTQAQINKGVTFVKDGYDQNSAVEIGDDAKAALDQSYVSSISSAKTLRNVSVAIGARASAVNPDNAATGQAVAIGYCANADGGQSVAIGSGAKHLDGEDDMTGHNAYAHGSTSVAIGYSSKAIGSAAVSLGSGKSGGASTVASGDQSVALGNAAQATAQGAVQIGTGVNDEANTLKFQNTTIVKDGKLCGFDDTSLDPKEIDISGAEEADMYPHIVNTLSTTVACGPGTEIGLNPKGSRNYEVYVPNDDQFVHGLPLNFDSELPDGIKLLFMNNKDTASKLPVMIKVQQPSKKNVLITVTELDDGTDWTPVVTNSFIEFDGVAGKFYCNGSKRSVEGKSLHHCTGFKIAYPSAGGVTTNDFVAASGNDPLISGTYYDYAVGYDFVPTSPVEINDAAEVKTWYEIIYKTVNGDAAVFHQDLKVSADGKYLINEPSAE